MTTHNTEVEGATPEFDLGDRMAKALQWGRVSRTEMADYMDVSTETLRRWTTSGGKGVRRSTLRLWALRTGVSFEWLETGYAIRDSNPEPADLEPEGEDAVVVPFPRPPADRQGQVCSVLAFPQAVGS